MFRAMLNCLMATERLSNVEFWSGRVRGDINIITTLTVQILTDPHPTGLSMRDKSCSINLNDVNINIITTLPAQTRWNQPL